MRVVLVTTFYSPEATGIAPYATEIAEHLAEQNYAVEVLTCLPHYPQWRIAPRYRRTCAMDERINGVHVKRLWLYVPRKQTAARRALYEASFFFHALVKYRPPRDTKLMLSIVPNLSNGALGARWGHQLNAPHVLMVQDLVGSGAQEAGLKGGKTVGTLVSRLETAVMRRAQLVSVCSKGFVPSVRNAGVADDRIVYLPNWSRLGQPTRTRENTRRNYGWDEATQVVLHAGNIGMKQGLDWLAEYAKEALQRAPRLRFVMVGHGNQRSFVEDVTRDLPNIQFVEPVPEEELPDLLAAADVLFLHERPTLQEMSLPSKLTAYFAAGRPVVAAVAPEGNTARHVEMSGGGAIAAAGNPPAVVDTINELLADPDRCAALGAAGLAHARSQYSREAAIGRLDELVERALSLGGREHPSAGTRG